LDDASHLQCQREIFVCGVQGDNGCMTFFPHVEVSSSIFVAPPSAYVLEIEVHCYLRDFFFFFPFLLPFSPLLVLFPFEFAPLFSSPLPAEA